jgi:hypothetical protein
MWLLVLLGTVGFGVFALSHIYGTLDVLMSVGLVIFAIGGIVIVFEVYLKHRIVHFYKTQITIQNMHKLSSHCVEFIKKYSNVKVVFQNSKLKMSSLKLKR